MSEQRIDTRFAHLDSSTFSVYGEYNGEEEIPVEGVIHITKGYSKGNTPELNQVVAQMKGKKIFKKLERTVFIQYARSTHFPDIC